MNCLAAATFSMVKLDPNTSSSSCRSSILSLSTTTTFFQFLTLKPSLPLSVSVLCCVVFRRRRRRRRRRSCCCFLLSSFFLFLFNIYFILMFIAICNKTTRRCVKLKSPIDRFVLGSSLSPVTTPYT